MKAAGLAVGRYQHAVRDHQSGPVKAAGVALAEPGREILTAHVVERGPAAARAARPMPLFRIVALLRAVPFIPSLMFACVRMSLLPFRLSSVSVTVFIPP